MRRRLTSSVGADPLSGCTCGRLRSAFCGWDRLKGTWPPAVCSAVSHRALCCWKLVLAIPSQTNKNVSPSLLRQVYEHPQNVLLVKLINANLDLLAVHRDGGAEGASAGEQCAWREVLVCEVLVSAHTGLAHGALRWRRRGRVCGRAFTGHCCAMLGSLAGIASGRPCTALALVRQLHRTQRQLMPCPPLLLRLTSALPISALSLQRRRRRRSWGAACGCGSTCRTA